MYVIEQANKHIRVLEWENTHASVRGSRSVKLNTRNHLVNFVSTHKRLFARSNFFHTLFTIARILQLYVSIPCPYLLTNRYSAWNNHHTRIVSK